MRSRGEADGFKRPFLIQDGKIDVLAYTQGDEAGEAGERLRFISFQCLNKTIVALAHQVGKPQSPICITLGYVDHLQQVVGDYLFLCDRIDLPDQFCKSSMLLRAQERFPGFGQIVGTLQYQCSRRCAPAAAPDEFRFNLIILGKKYVL
jgi:hypothetical protein